MQEMSVAGIMDLDYVAVLLTRKRTALRIAYLSSYYTPWAS